MSLKFQRNQINLISPEYILFLYKLIEKNIKIMGVAYEGSDKSKNYYIKYSEVCPSDCVTHSIALVLNEKLWWDDILAEPIEEYFQLLKNKAI